jgi:hypothetical protein
MKTIKRNDIILLCTLISLGAILLTVITFIFSGKGEDVVIRIDGEEYARLPLSKDTELIINSEHGENFLVIKDRKAYVKSASCPKQVCVNSGYLSEISPIICKHNHLSITLE